MLTAPTTVHAPRGRRVRVAPPADYLYVPTIVRWSFIGFAGALPFEATSLAFTSSTFSLAKLSGLMFIGCYLFFYNPLSGKRSFPSGSAALSWFMIYLLVFVANGLFLDAYYLPQYVSILATLCQLLLLFWISSSLLRVELLARRVLLAFAFGAVLCAVGSLIGVPGFSTVIESRGGERITAMGFNPNYLAYTMALAAVILIGAALDHRVRHLWSKVFLIALVLPLLAMIVRSGSRTGLGAFAIGFAACMLPNRQSGRKAILIFLALVVGAALTYLVVHNPTILTRLEESSEGDLSGRQVIVPASLELISQRPVFGWQPVVYWEELGRRVGKIWGTRDAHNLVFHVLLETGLLGAVPFFLGVGLCVICGWRARKGKFGNLPFALLIMTLVSNLTHTYLARKSQWLIFALAVAAATTVVKRSVAARFLIRQPLRSSERAAAGQVFAPGRPR
jgi:O-antigen ligase